MSKRKIVTETVEKDIWHYSADLLEDVIVSLSEKLEYLKKKYPEALSFSLTNTYYGYDGGFDIDVVMERLETDKEYNNRMAKLKKEKETAAAKEAKELEKVKKAVLGSPELQKELLTILTSNNKEQTT